MMLLAAIVVDRALAYQACSTAVTKSSQMPAHFAPARALHEE